MVERINQSHYGLAKNYRFVMLIRIDVLTSRSHVSYNTDITSIE